MLTQRQGKNVGEPTGCGGGKGVEQVGVVTLLLQLQRQRRQSWPKSALHYEYDSSSILQQQYFRAVSVKPIASWHVNEQQQKEKIYNKKQKHNKYRKREKHYCGRKKRVCVCGFLLRPRESTPLWRLMQK